MVEYKCVPAPTELMIDSGSNYGTAISSFANLINNESNGGWKFYSMENIAVTQQPGCLAGLFGAKSTTAYFNMLIFVKE